MKGGHVGIELSPRKRRKIAGQMRAEERAWRARNGPVVVTRVESCQEIRAPERQPVAPGEGDRDTRTHSASP